MSDLICVCLIRCVFVISCVFVIWSVCDLVCMRFMSVYVRVRVYVVIFRMHVRLVNCNVIPSVYYTLCRFLLFTAIMYCLFFCVCVCVIFLVSFLICTFFSIFLCPCVVPFSVFIRFYLRVCTWFVFLRLFCFVFIFSVHAQTTLIVGHYTRGGGAKEAE